MSEPVDWTKDRFGQGIPSGIRYDKMRDNKNYDPIENETLNGYTERLYKWIQAIEDINLNAHVYGRKTWYTRMNSCTHTVTLPHAGYATQSQSTGNFMKHYKTSKIPYQIKVQNTSSKLHQKVYNYMT